MPSPSRSPRVRAALLSTALVAVAALPRPGALAWDSASGNPTHPTHTYLTEWAINQLARTYPELAQPAIRQAVIDGANTELHELASRKYEREMAQKYNLPLEQFRVRFKGTNEGCADLAGWWAESLSEYRQRRPGRAYFLLGVILHMIQDMGVPAHANRVYHQGNLTEFDNFEFLALANWKPNFNAIDRPDPNLAEPWQYYAVSEQWTRADAPNYRNRNAFSKTWLTASPAEKRLLQERQARTCAVTMWALGSGARAFGARPAPPRP